MTLTRAIVPLLLAGVGLALLATPFPACAQEEKAAQPSFPPIATRSFKVGAFTLALRADTQTLARLSPATDPAFDFVPGAREAERQGDGYVHIGDIHLRLREAGGAWRDFSSAAARKPIRILPSRPGELAAADITLSMGSGFPLTVERRWVKEKGVPALRFTLVNRGKLPIEIGVLGLPMVFDNIISDRSLEEAHAQASFTDPYIGRDAGYLQVTRLSGKGPALLVLPERSTPLEAYVPIPDVRREKGGIFTDRSPRAQTSEGFYDWTVASKGYVDREWKSAGEQWNAPTSITLAPGATRIVGVRFVLSPSIRAIEDSLAAQGRPVAIGVPGYVVPMDMDATLFVKSQRPITRIESIPAGALSATQQGKVGGWTRIALKAHQWGRARLALSYTDGTVQTIGYFVTKPLDQVMADLGRFTTQQQFYEDKGDPFHRAPAILSYDRDAGKILTQEPRVWIAGMSDEGGAGSWVAAAAKQLDNPDPTEVAKIEALIDKTVIGTLTVAEGPARGAVRKSIFYYDPEQHPGYYDAAFDWRSWTSWSKKDAADLGRAYNYPHVAIGYWVMYRLARNHLGLVRVHGWRWYLDHAFLTVEAMMRDAPYYTQFGLMEGDVFVDILKDLQREGLADQAAKMEGWMKSRADHWKTLDYPFGSEMAWDSTGQPEVYAWMRYFHHQPQADVTREAILGYDPTIPSWGYNGNARRYWDFLYGGKYPRIERQIHHYGSTLNAIPLFDAYRANPADMHLLRVAYGGLMGGITNIDQHGFGSAAFHSWPDMMKWDPYTGDYGMGFFGHAYAAATYLVKDTRFGWLGYGGNLEQHGAVLHFEPKDGARTRLFIAPAALWITLEAGKIKAADYIPVTGRVRLVLDPADAVTPAARLYLETTTPTGGPYTVPGAQQERGGYTIPLSNAPSTLSLVPR